MYKILSIITSLLFPAKNRGPTAVPSDFLSPEKFIVGLPRSKRIPHPGMIGLYAYRHAHVRSFIWEIKYRRNIQAISCAGYALYTYIETLRAPPPVIIIPMPSSRKRKNERGYNQCELICHAILDFDQKRPRCVETYKNILFRRKHTEHQTKKNKTGREKSMKNVFYVKPRKDLLEKHIIIIDDVITTGTTMSEAIATLKNAGYLHIYGIALAQ
jgi:ComF family protein